jgi:hypothetical protein
VCLSESVDFQSFLEMYWPVFLVFVFVCSCVTVYTGRQTDPAERIAKQYQHIPWHAEITRTPLSCGVDECDADSLSLRIHMYIHRHTSMHDCLFAFLSIPDRWWPHSDSLSLLIQSIFVLFCFVLLSIPYSWLPNSLFLLDTGFLICPTTSCRPCHRTFFTGCTHFSECACFAWLSTFILCLRHTFHRTQACMFVGFLS